MIKKFQQGGQADLAIMLFVLGIAQELQADPQLVVLAAQQNPEALKAAVQVFLETQDIKLAAQTFAQVLQQKTQAAKHGAKLNYIKSLKHQCAEDEEVYYFKKGGSVGCGCRKKEDGGEVTKASKGCSAIKKFKASYGTKFPESRKPNPHAPKAEKEYLALRDKDRLALANRELQKEKANQARNKKAFELAEKDDGKYVANNGDAFPPAERGRKPVVKKSCGSKLKKHFNGGSLNRIPFMQQGKNLPTAPKAEKRYKNGRIVWNTPEYKEVSSASDIFGDPFASKIAMEVSNNDTTFYETPGRWLPVKLKKRTAKSTSKVYKPIQVSDDGFKSYRVIGIDPEYEILKRRFNTAWNLAK